MTLALLTTTGKTLRFSASCHRSSQFHDSNILLPHSAFDSCSDTGYVDSNPYRPRSSSYTQAAPSHSGILTSHPHMNIRGRSYEDDGEFHSLPVTSTKQSFTEQLRCLSLEAKPDRRLDSSQQPLYSSSSAPTTSELRFRRRLSLGPLARSESWQGVRPKG